jgi:outer membrane protein
MKNLSLILNGVLLLLVAHLYYLHFSKKATAPDYIAPSTAVTDGIKIAYVNIDTLDAKYEWLKTQKAALEASQKNKETTLKKKQEAFMADAQAFQEKAQSGNFPEAQLRKEADALQGREQKLMEEQDRLSKQFAEEYKTAMDKLMGNVEAQLKSIQSQIGYDYILSYSKGGNSPVLLANDSLEITKQVLDLLNKKEQQ